MDLLQELHGAVGEESVGQRFSGRALDEVPLKTVKRDRQVQEIECGAKSVFFII